MEGFLQLRELCRVRRHYPGSQYPMLGQQHRWFSFGSLCILTASKFSEVNLFQLHREEATFQMSRRAVDIVDLDLPYVRRLFLQMEALTEWQPDKRSVHSLVEYVGHRAKHKYLVPAVDILTPMFGEYELYSSTSEGVYRYRDFRTSRRTIWCTREC